MSAGTKIEIEWVGAGDIPALARVWHDAWHVGHAHLDPEIARGRPFAFFEARVAGAVGHTLLARIDGDVVGFAGWEGDGIGQVFVAPDWHGKGVAAPLLAAAEEVLKQQGHSLIWLQCRVGNDRARRFYEKHDWYVAAEVDADIGTVTGREPILVWRMEKRLG